MVVAREVTRARKVHTVQAIGPGGDPKGPPTIAPKSRDIVPAERVPDLTVVQIMKRRTCPRVEQVEPVARQVRSACTDPEAAIRRFVNRRDVVAAQARRV